MKICIVTPPSPKRYFDTAHIQMPSPTLAHLGGYLIDRSDHEVFLIDGKLSRYSPTKTVECIKSFAPDVLGISCTTTDAFVAKSIAKALKSSSVTCQIIVGGAHPSALPIDTLLGCKEYDIAVVGEGEETFLELINALEKKDDFQNIKGCAFRRNGKIFLTPPRKAIDINKSPMPAWNRLRKGEKYYIQIARGCPGKCSFCFNMFGKQIRTVSSERVIEEIEYILSLFQPDEFCLGAPTFGIPRKYSFEILDALIDSGLNKIIKWDAETRVDVPDLQLFLKMRTGGCRLVALGIESGNNQILTRTGKNTSTDKIEQCVNEIKKAGMETMGFFIFGHPYETKETTKHTSDFAVKLNLTHSTFGIMTPWPGTEVYQLAKHGKAGYFLSDIPVEGLNKHFGKRALYFQNFSILYLQWLRIRSYFFIFFKNRRFRDGFNFFIKNYLAAFYLLRDALYAFFEKR